MEKFFFLGFRHIRYPCENFKLTAVLKISLSGTDLKRLALLMTYGCNKVYHLSLSLNLSFSPKIQIFRYIYPWVSSNKHLIYFIQTRKKLELEMLFFGDAPTSMSVFSTHVLDVSEN